MNYDQGTDDWLCARQQDNNFISTYAAENPTRFFPNFFYAAALADLYLPMDNGESLTHHHFEI